MARSAVAGGFCVLTLMLCGCPPWGSPGPPATQGVLALEPAAPLSSGVYVAVYGRSDGITMFRADPAPVGTWVSIDPGVVYPRVIAADPRVPARVYVIGSVNSSSNASRVRRSDDRGATWTTVFDTPDYADAIVPDPIVADRLWLTLTYPSAGQPIVQRSDNAGQTWVGDAAGLPPMDFVASLTLDASGSGLRYLCDSQREAYRADAPGAAHVRISPPAKLLLADPSVPDRVYAWDSNGQLARSNDRGNTWISLAGGSFVGAARSNLVGLSIDPSDPNRLYMAVSPSGVHLSDDGGQTFQPTTLARPVGGIVVDPTASASLFVAPASDNDPAFVSDDRGVTWRSLDMTTALLEPFSGGQATP